VTADSSDLVEGSCHVESTEATKYGGVATRPTQSDGECRFDGRESGSKNSTEERMLCEYKTDPETGKCGAGVS
jgi:hypothetical protein